ncbi:MAG: type II and III secretion system protein family protein [Phycisphaeraceae bacterium]|nr:MAG: type II and III secretion system protein family protein [Phycisphaeraceae bacterium]
MTHARGRLIPILFASLTLLASSPIRADVPVTPLEADPLQVEVPVGRSQVIEPGWKISEVAVADDEIADVKVVNPGRVMIIGKSVGATDVTMWDPQGKRWEARVIVEVDYEMLRRTLEDVLTGSDLRLKQSEDVMIVSGTLRQAEQADMMHRFLDAAEIKYVDMTRVAGLQQVMIKVRVAEANRIAIRSLGINAVHSGDSAFGGSTIGGNPNSIDIGIPGNQPAQDNLLFNVLQSATVGDATTLFAGFQGLDFEMFVEALEDNQYLRTLAEPTLVAMSGEKASFLAGGEFPIPVASAGAGGATQISIEWKEFGVRLNFLPTVMGDGEIRLQVAPEVSDLSDVGAVELEGFRIPSLLTRRAATTLRMRSGQTFAMAGLLDRKVAGRTQKVPGLGNIPILGALFSSVRYEHGETELLVLATVDLVEPMDTTVDVPMPGDTHVKPNAWELYAEGKLHGEAAKPESPAVWAADMGLDRLMGPGAWATHDQQRLPVAPADPDDSANKGEDEEER